MDIQVVVVVVVVTTTTNNNWCCWVICCYGCGGGCGISCSLGAVVVVVVFVVVVFVVMVVGAYSVDVAQRVVAGEEVRRKVQGSVRQDGGVGGEVGAMQDVCHVNQRHVLVLPA